MRHTKLLGPHFLIAFCLVTGAAIGLDAAIAFMGIHLQKLEVYPADGLAFRSLPAETQGWTRSRPDPPPLSAEMVEELGTSNYLTRRYGSRDGDRAREFELHCAYYTGMIDTVPHVPERCFVGNGGLSLDGTVGTIVRIPLDLDRFPNAQFVDTQLHGEVRRGRTGSWSETPGRYVHMPRELETLSMNVSHYIGPDGYSLYAGYFFIANGGIVPRAEQVRQLAFRHEDKYAYYAKIQFSSSSVTSAEELGELAADFLNEMLPDLVLRTPDWIDVREGRYPIDSVSGSLSKKHGTFLLTSQGSGI
jgi:hypothetical protein